MKNIFILIFVLFVKSSFSQFTYVPDDNFEQALINLGVDSVIDDYVYTASIDTVTVLYVNNKNISDLSGICLLYTSPSPRDSCASRMPSSA